MQYPSKWVEKAVDAFATLPGVGKKTALRMVLFLLKEEKSKALALGDAVRDLRENIRYCDRCHNISDDELCNLCASASRDQSTICVVQDSRDVLAIESAGQYNGLYHILGGVINPLDGIGPDQLNIQSLLDRIKRESPAEIIMALSSTMEADTTAFYISKQLDGMGVRISAISRGLPVGGELEYADELTLARSFALRNDYRPG